jgi:hypothetical protein
VRRHEDLDESAPLAGVPLEYTTNTEYTAAVDPTSVRVWGCSMDYLDNRASYSYLVVYSPCGGRGSAEKRELISAQQVVSE